MARKAASSAGRGGGSPTSPSRARRDDLARVVRLSSLPTLLLSVPDGTIVAASEEAATLLGVPARELAGRNADEFAADRPPAVLELVHSGRLTAFQSTRLLRKTTGDPEPLQVWVQAAGSGPPIDCAVAVLWPRGRKALRYLPVSSDSALMVVGSVDERLQIERVSEDVRLVGLEPDSVIGMSFLGLIAVPSAANALVATADATSSGRGVSLSVVLTDGRVEEPAELMIRPVLPSPSFVFALVRGVGLPALTDGGERQLAALGLGLHALSVADVLRATKSADVPGVERLTTRELDVVARVLAGDRVPAIAAAMFVSQSTVRNHLSSTFRKLGVSTQQGLIQRFRESAIRPSDVVTPSME